MGRDGHRFKSLVQISGSSWLRIVLSLLLAVAAIILLVNNVNLTDIQSSLEDVDSAFVVLALLIFLFTIFVKVWRWQWMFPPGDDRPRFGALYSALILGQFFNFIFPLRIGELARVYSLDRQSHVGKAAGLSTVVIEKSLEVVALFLSTLLLIPFIILPTFVVENGYPLALAGLLILGSLVLMAYRTDQVARFVQYLSRPLPQRIEQRVNSVLVAGLEGLGSLRNWRLTLWLGLLSIFIVFLAILTPYFLFRAFNLPLGLEDAVILNLVLTLGMIPPSTPGKIVVFEGIVILMLRQFGIEDGSLMLSFAIVFHLLIALPQILLGAIAFARGGSKVAAFPNEGEEQLPDKGSLKT